MRFQDLPVESFPVRVKSTDGSSLAGLFARTASPVPVAKVSVSETEGSFELALADSSLSVTPIKADDVNPLIRELSIGRAMLSQLSELAADGSAELRIAFFTGSVLEMGDVEIGVDEYVEKGVNHIEKRKVRDVYSSLEGRCTFTHLGETYFFLAAGPAIKEALEQPDEASIPAPQTDGAFGTEGNESEGDLDDESTATLEVGPHIESDLRNSFCVTGTDMRFVATTHALPSGKAIYVATKLTARKQDSDKTIHLARGNLKFLDWTSTGQIQLQAKTQLAVLTADESSYLKKWDEFGDLEGEILLDTARAIGGIEFTDARPNRDGTIDVRVTEATAAGLEALASGQLTDLEAVGSLPEYITNPDFTFSDFSARLEESLTRKQDRAIHLEVADYDRETKTLTLRAEAVPSVGTLVMSMAGDVAQIKRRLRARKAILQGRSANPQLGLLVEEKGEITSLRTPQRIKPPLTAFVREKVFKDPPTYRQELAIDVALNTPDIAVIQGPPGTGKTTVIAAILERLNEIAIREGVRGQGKVLLSGFQHDAVENMIDRMSLNGLPVPKFQRSTEYVSGYAPAFLDELEAWCGKVAKELREKNPQIAELEEESAIKDLYKQYLRNPTHKLATTLVTRIAEIDVTTLGEKLSRQAATLRKRLTTQAVAGEDQGRHLAAAQRIRTRAESFTDDGPGRAEDALVDLEDVLDERQAALLERASSWNTDRGAPPFLGELAHLKRTLLVHLTSPPVFKIEKHSDEVLHLAEKAIERVKNHGFTATDKKSAALAEFLAELENNPFGMVDAASEFSFAYAATVQYAGSEGMHKRVSKLKGGDGLDDYEYVIVDEAARVSPRDLMIPMSQGKRIILVGDHRQLPHIIDEEVARRMEAGEDVADESEWLKKSMFQYLFTERLKALEEADGITRRVTLDQQFRMHPELGRFVSRNFYEAFDTTEKFDSPLLANKFTHNLPGTDNRPAMWLPVPAARGAAQRQGTSWIRQPEIDVICRQLGEWIESPEGADLTYGVISFYKAQADRIRSELKRQLGEIVDDHKKIRVGTVDSFQGMEFDVVFLSVVRIVRPNWTPRDQDPALQARSLFGHLCLYNRLNVSMSRQKKLLVAVGDPSLVAHDLAGDFIPGLVDFYRLAGGAKALKTAARQHANPRPQHVDPAPESSTTDKPARGAIGRLFGRGDG